MAAVAACPFLLNLRYHLPEANPGTKTEEQSKWLNSLSFLCAPPNAVRSLPSAYRPLGHKTVKDTKQIGRLLWGMSRSPSHCQGSVSLRLDARIHFFRNHDRPKVICEIFIF